MARLDYYTDEKTAEVMVYVPVSGIGKQFKVDLVFEFEFLLRDHPAYPAEWVPVPFSLERLREGNNEITVSFYENDKWMDSRKVDIVILPGHPCPVKCDMASGGLVAGGLPFFPFGFYSYWPIEPAALDEEAARGFNLISPYWKIEKKTLKERRQFMDRCAALGIKVNYNLCSVAGGGGVSGSRNGAMTRAQKEKLLVREVEEFRDHHALLAWYIADEPEGQGVPPDSLVQTYSLLKELDPYHPVSIVFMAPNVAVNYAGVMDIAMTDPYPLPHEPVTVVADYTKTLHGFFAHQKPVWTVPQAFGGSEWWHREPTRAEVRAMTYVALVSHASGIQYFVRMAPNGFPKSAALWGECGALALEVAELTPQLLSANPAPGLEIQGPGIMARALNADGLITILAVNTSNAFVPGMIRMAGLDLTGEAEVMFAGRNVAINSGVIEEMMEPYGTRVYRIDARKRTARMAGPRKDNLVIDPGFEETAAAGIPSSCYFKTGEDKGSTCFTDTRRAYQGDRSIRLNNPSDKEGLTVSLFNLELDDSRSYTISVWAMAPGNNDGKGPLQFDLGLGDMGRQSFTLAGGWQQYAFTTAAFGNPAKGLARRNPGLSLKGRGTAWFDLLEVYPDMELTATPKPGTSFTEITLASSNPAAKVFYTLDGLLPTMESTVYNQPFLIEGDAKLRAAAYAGQTLSGYIEQYYDLHRAVGCPVGYLHPYQKYTAGGEMGLVDGVLASERYNDGKWQGFNFEDALFTVDLGQEAAIRHITARFLQDQFVWIFLPESVQFWISRDGEEFTLLKQFESGISPMQEGAIIVPFEWEGEATARFIRVTAKNRGVCPPGHKGAGGRSWIFTDEILVE
jgi:hypothetical protein